MDLLQLIILIAVGALVAIGAGVGLLVRSRRTTTAPRRPSARSRSTPTLELDPEHAGRAAGRHRASGRPRPSSGPRAPSRGWSACASASPARRAVLGRSLLALLSRDKLDEDTWESIEDLLLTADVGVAPTQQVVDNLRTRLRVGGDEAGDPKAVLRDELIALVDPTMDRRLKSAGPTASPASSSSSASTAPARPPRSARSPGSSSPRAAP